jgi:NADPH2:quinone reductase
MKAYVYGHGGATISDVAQPKPKGTQVLVRVRACGLNRADTGMRKGHAHGAAGGAGTVLGMEWAGEVAELGPDAKGVKVGDRIMGSGGAAFAEYTLADHGRIFRSPSNMNFDEAATLPVALATMHNAVVTNGALQPGQSVMIQGASSGVGLMAMQIAKLKGAKLVVGSSTDAYRRGRLKEFGADLAVDSSDPGWVDQVLKATNGEGVDLIVDQVSGKVASQNQNQGPHCQCRPARRHPRRVQFRPARRAPHPLYRRHLPHPDHRRNPRDLRRGPQGHLAGRGITEAATADRQGLQIRRDRKSVRAHGSQQASRQDRRDAVAPPCPGGGAAAFTVRRRAGTHRRWLCSRNVIRPVSPRLRCGFTVISTSWSNAVSIRSSFSTEASLNWPRRSLDRSGCFIATSLAVATWDSPRSAIRCFNCTTSTALS